MFSATVPTVAFSRISAKTSLSHDVTGEALDRKKMGQILTYSTAAHMVTILAIWLRLPGNHYRPTSLEGSRGPVFPACECECMSGTPAEHSRSTLRSIAQVYLRTGLISPDSRIVRVPIPYPEVEVSTQMLPQKRNLSNIVVSGAAAATRSRRSESENAQPIQNFTATTLDLSIHYCPHLCDLPDSEVQSPIVRYVHRRE
jgi:hypothetical protein